MQESEPANDGLRANWFVLLVVGAIAGAGGAVALEKFEGQIKIREYLYGRVSLKNDQTFNPEERVEAKRQRIETGTRGIARGYALIAGAIALLLCFAEGIAQRSVVMATFGALLAAALGAGLGAGAGLATESWRLDMVEKAQGQSLELSKVIMFQAGGFALLGLAVGLAVAIGTTLRRIPPMPIIAGVIGGVIAGAIYYPLAGIAFPTEVSDLSIPTGYISNTLGRPATYNMAAWGALVGGIIGLVLGGVKVSRKAAE
ncbi:MAG TPA: hypothetical protein VNC50_07640 [Planctomycetia bacterium]|nr:hypothetical protein [Planctomycetia bacterium]